MERGQEKDPLLEVKTNFNRWAQANEAGGKGQRMRLDLTAEPGVIAMVQQALGKGDLSGIASAAQLVIGERMEQRKKEVLGQAGCLDMTIEDRLARDQQYLALQHQSSILAGGDTSVLMDQSVFDATMEYLNEQERSKSQQ